MASGSSSGYHAQATPDAPDADQEAFCYRTRTETTTGTPPNEVTTVTLGDEILPGWARHDDTLPPPGIAFFDSTGQPLAPGSFEAVACVEPCCDQVLDEGCWNDGTDSGVWVSIRDSDGNVTLTDPVTGLEVDAADVVACPVAQYRTEVRTVNANGNLAIPGAGLTLVSWTVRARTGSPELNVSGVTTVMDEGEVLGSSTQDDTGVLEDAPVITTGAGETARVSWLIRTEP